VVKRWTKITL